MKNNWLLPLTFLVVPLGTSAQVIISEIMYDLPEPGGDTGREWIEIYNTGNSAVDLSGWRLFEGGVNHKLVIRLGNTVLPVGGFAVLADKPEKFLSEHTGFSGTIFDSTFSLNNATGEKLALKNASSTIINEVTYTIVWGAKGDGNSLQYFPDGWSASLPTPGTANIKSVPKPAPSQNFSTQSKTVPPVTKETVTTEKKPIAKNSDVSTSSASAPIISDIPEDQNSLPWWLLLGGVVIVASAAYWIGGRSDPDEFTIIEDRSE